ncbi:hypothetical protein BLOT_000897 [Blomia tropicalis]|nr:hypothetical protein BLOT_000897 [Blomia tropicalis]
MSQGNIKQLRSSLSLDFTLGPSQTKKVKYDNFFLESPDIAKIFANDTNMGPQGKKMKFDNYILATPDMAKIALSTPELDNLLLNSFQQQTSISQNLIRNQVDENIKGVWSVNNHGKLKNQIKDEEKSDEDIKFVINEQSMVFCFMFNHH